MYNYQRKLDYYNYENNNYNQPLYTKNENPNSVLDPYNGLIRGNLFPTLYNEYKVRPADLQPSNEKMQQLIMIDALGFAKIDINLYLDVYPNDRDMIELFNQYSIESDRLIEDYESKYGPIFVDGNARNAYPWSWNNEPWPWENR